MEVFADLLSVPIEEVGELSFQVEEEPPPVSSTCVVFAKSEASALLRKGWPKNKVIAAYCNAMAHRVVTLLERIGVEKDFAITGGIGKDREGTEHRSSEGQLRYPDRRGSRRSALCESLAGKEQKIATIF